MRGGIGTHYLRASAERMYDSECTIYRKKEIYNEFGDPITGYGIEYENVPCAVAEISSNTPRLQPDLQVISMLQWVVLMDPSVDVIGGDQIHVNGDVFEVEGENTAETNVVTQYVMVHKVKEPNE